MNRIDASLPTILFSLCALFTSAASFADAGQVKEISGSVTVERGGLTLTLAKDAAIQSGDILVTSDTGTVGVQMVNGEEIYLRPNSNFTIEQFSAPTTPSNPATGRSFYSLLKGAFRVITKSLGRRGLDSYRISTPVATIGIRGSIVIGAFDVANGLSTGVEEGAAFVTNAAGTVEVPAGGFATVTSATVAPAASSTPTARGAAITK